MFTTSNSENSKLNNTNVLDKEHQNIIMEFFNKNEKYIFQKIIFEHIFDANVRYLDKSIFIKVEPYLKKYFESYNFTWDNYALIVRGLVLKSRYVTTLRNKQMENLQYYFDNPMTVEMAGKFANVLKEVVDYSIIDSHNLLPSFASVLIAHYDYEKNKNKSDPYTLYSRLISTINLTLLNNLIASHKDNAFECLVKFIIKRFNLIGVKNYDEKVIVKAILTHHLYGKFSSMYPELEKSALSSRFANIVQNIIKNNIQESITINKILKSPDKNENTVLSETKKVQTDKVETKKTENEKDESLTKKVIKNKNETPKPKEKIEQDEILLDDIDLYLSKLGKKTKKAKSTISKFFNDAKKEVEEINIIIDNPITLEAELDGDELLDYELFLY